MNFSKAFVNNVGSLFFYIALSLLQIGYVGMQFMSKATRDLNQIWSMVLWKWPSAAQSGRDSERHGYRCWIRGAQRKESATPRAIKVSDAFEYGSCLFPGHCLPWCTSGQE